MKILVAFDPHAALSSFSSCFRFALICLIHKRSNWCRCVIFILLFSYWFSHKVQKKKQMQSKWNCACELNDVTISFTVLIFVWDEVRVQFSWTNTKKRVFCVLIRTLIYLIRSFFHLLYLHWYIQIHIHFYRLFLQFNAECIFFYAQLFVTSSCTFSSYSSSVWFSGYCWINDFVCHTIFVENIFLPYFVLDTRYQTPYTMNAQQIVYSHL